MHSRAAIIGLVCLWLSCQYAGNAEATGGGTASGAATEGFRIEKYVEYKDVVDATGSTFLNGTFDLKALNDQGELYIEGNLSDPVLFGRTGLFVLTTSTWHEIVHEPLNAGLFGDSRPSVNAGRQGAFRSYQLGGITGHVHLPTLTLLASDGTLTNVLKQGDAFGPDNAQVVDISELPSINSTGDVGLTVYTTIPGVKDEYFVGYYSGGEFHTLAQQGDPAPEGGVLMLNILPVPPAWLNDQHQALFLGYSIGGPAGMQYGTYRVTGTTVERIALSGDVLPTGHAIRALSTPHGTMNNAGDVAFEAELDGLAEFGVFEDREGAISKIYVKGDASPLGGPFLSVAGHRLGEGPFLEIPTINDRGSILFKAVAKSAKRKVRVGLFLYTPDRGIEKVVAVGDRMQNGKRVHEVGAYSLNNLDQVAFSVTFKSKATGNVTEGIYLATPDDSRP